MAFTRPRAAQIDFDVTNISDPLIRLNSAETGSADKDVGIVIERGDDTNVAVLYDESADQFVLVNTTEDGSTSGNVTISSYAGLQANAIVYGSLNDGTTTLTATVAELNILDGVTATATELNYVSGVTSAIQTQIDNISSSFTLAADSGTNDTFTTGETLTIAGGTGIDTTVSDNNISVAIDSNVATLTGTQTLTNKTITSPTISNPTLTGTYTFTSDATSTPAMTLTANSINDGVGALRINGSQADIFLNPSTATHTTITFAVNDDQRLAFGMDNNSDFYITRRTSSTWYDDTFVLDRDTGLLSLGYGATVAGTLTYSTLNDGTTALTSTVAELNVLDGITATTAELNYVDGVTSNVQTQLDAKAPLAAPAFTGTATGVNLTLSGDLTVNGTTTTVNTTNLVVSDNLIELNNGAASNANDSGIVIERGNTGDNAIFAWDESADAFVMGTTTATGASTGDLTIANGELRLDTLRIDQSGAGLRMTNVGAFDNDGSDNFRIFASNNLQLKANGDSGGGLSIDVTNNDVTIDNDLRVSAGQFYYGGTAVTSTATELNLLDGVTATTAELNILDGVTATTAELNYTDGVTSNIQTQLDTKASLTGSETLTNKTLTSPQVNTNIDLLAQADLRFYDSDDSNYVGFQAPATASGNILWTLPGSDGTEGQVLSTNGGGTLAWEDPGSGGGSGSSYPNSTFSTVPGTNGDFDLSYNVAQTTQETPFEASGTDAFGVNLGSVFSLMDPVGSLESIDYGDSEAYVGA